MSNSFNLIIIGAGTAGIPAAIFASSRTNRILVVDAAPRIGGTLHLSSGQMSAAGTKLQERKGIKDSPKLHLEDIIRISKGTANYELAKLAVYNASETLDWLEDLGFTPLKDHPVKGQAHEPYSVNRYVWGNELGLSILKTINQPFEKAINDEKVDLQLNTRVTKILTSSSADIEGVEVINASGDTKKFFSDKIIIASGGYVANAKMYSRFSGHPAYGKHSYPYCLGDSISLAENLNAQTWGKENYLTSFGVIMNSYDVPSTVRLRQIHWPERRMPWEIYVNKEGKRFIREDEPSVDKREHSILNQADLRHWIIFDTEILENSPSIFKDFSKEDIKQAAKNNEPMFYMADDIVSLSAKAGINGENLKVTIEDYNRAQSDGKDIFKRIHMPKKIEKPPYYAIRSQAMSVSSSVGLRVNSSLEVINNNMEPIKGLYAAGEAIGQGALMGSSFCGGMLVTPALTFGRLLGEKIIPLNTISNTSEVNGPEGLEPTRFGDWEKNGRCSDF